MAEPSTIFGVLPAGLPLLTTPSSTPTPTSLLYELPTAKSFSHIVVFLLPNVKLPEESAAAIYIATTAEVAAAQAEGRSPNFRFLGGVGPGKESAVFKVNWTGCGSGSGLIIGIEVENGQAVSQRMQELALTRSSASSGCKDLAGSSSQPSTSVLAQRIIQNAFNFLTSFSGTTGPEGVEVVPLKAFQEWWHKFESRVRADPSFLEKQQD